MFQEAEMAATDPCFIVKAWVECGRWGLIIDLISDDIL